jgi:hypothetical protein
MTAIIDEDTKKGVVDHMIIGDELGWSEDGS